ncbi:MAG: hypothetical protein V4608_13430 [Bacteroidota bacterium]
MKFKNIGKKGIISLIKDDLIHIRLVYGLEILGLNADNYSLRLTETIFQLVGIRIDNDDFFEDYMDECRTILNMDIFKHPELLNSMALSLYKKLITEYKTQKHEK